MGRVELSPTGETTGLKKALEDGKVSPVSFNTVLLC